MKIRVGSRRGPLLVVGLILGVSALIASSVTSALEAPVNLGTTQSFAVLAGAGVTNTGPSTISGDLGTCPTPAITGFPPGTVINGTIHAADAVCLQAQSDLTIAYNDAAGRAPTTTYPGVQDLGGLTLTPGVYKATAFAITGTLTLDAQGDPGAVWIFQAGSTLITAVNSSVIVINGGQPCNVFWQVGSSATLGVGSTFVGTVLALTDITANTNATVQGRLMARNGAVTLDSNTVTRPICAPTPTTTSSTTSSSTTVAPTTSSSTTSTTLAPTTSSSTTSTSTIVPPITVPPITVPPITVPPITVPPITIPPITIPPITIPPITLPPVTVPPVTLPTTTSTTTTLLPTTTSTAIAATTTTAVGATTTTVAGESTGATTTSSSTTTTVAAATTTTSTVLGSTTSTDSDTTTTSGATVATTAQGGGTAGAVTTGTLVRTGSPIRSMQFWAVAALVSGGAILLATPRKGPVRHRRRRFEMP
jgi:hypothetical protein